MPRVMTFGPYILFFWMGENGEPVHIHVSVGKPSPSSAKIWLTSDGGCLVAKSHSDIPAKDMRSIMKLIRLNHADICEQWVETFGQDRLTFYR